MSGRNQIRLRSTALHPAIPLGAIDSIERNMLRLSHIASHIHLPWSAATTGATRR